MAKGVNKVILVGNCGQDPESKFMPSGGAVTNLSIATSESWKDKQTGAMQERTEWHRVVFFNRLAEIVGEYVKKGSKLYVEGSLRTRKWQDQNGVDRYSTEIVANEMQMLDSRMSGDQSGGYAPQQQAGGYNNAPQQQAPQQQSGGYGGGAAASGAAFGGAANNMGGSNAPAPQQPAPSFDDFDDDIPF